jgi:peptidoglycan/xylan/chitin deacetylase (PgdA/CDA1 family)
MTDLLVLGYHAVSAGWHSDLSVTPENLERQLSSLVRRGYRGACFHEAATSAPTDRTLVVTFDDAYRSVLELALPIMQALDLPGVVFVPTRFAGGGERASWPGVNTYLDGAHAQELEVMSWEELAQLHTLGWEIGSHTCSHPHLTQLDDHALHEELARSRAECESHLGAPCHSLAYPYGDTDTRVIAATASAGYTAAAGLPRFRDLHEPSALNWPRIGIFHDDGPRTFRFRISPTARRLSTGLSRRPHILMK